VGAFLRTLCPVSFYWRILGTVSTFVKGEERNKLVENMVRIMLLDPKASKAPVAVKAALFEGQTSLLYA
jgi:hypothetical protein